MFGPFTGFYVNTAVSQCGIKTAPPGTLWCPFMSWAGQAFRVCAFIVYLSALCVRECAFAGAALPVCSHTCFLTRWGSWCGLQSEALWSRSHCFLYDCLRGCFHPTHWLYYVSHIVSDIGGSLCLSFHHYKSSLESLCSKCEEACQDVFGAWLKNVSHWRFFFFNWNKCHCVEWY